MKNTPITEEGASAKYMENVGYLFGGYNIYEGSPHAPGTVDPGFQMARIFNVSYEFGQTTSDKRFLIPDYTSVVECIACATAFKSTIITSSKSYRESISQSVKVDVKFWSASFGASTEYQHVESETRKHKAVFTYAKAVCTVYCAGVDLFAVPPLMPAFRAAVKA